jgi:hypothetical protein
MLRDVVQRFPTVLDPGMGKEWVRLDAQAVIDSNPLLPQQVVQHQRLL